MIARHHARLLAPLALMTLAAPAPAGSDGAGNSALTAKHSIAVTVTGLRSSKGQVLACLAATRDNFPNCTGDDGRALVIPADTDSAQPLQFAFKGVPAGRYAIALLHDENKNGKIDKALIIPREGFGFSQNAPLRMGPPAFKDAAFTVDDDGASQSIRMRYIM